MIIAGTILLLAHELMNPYHFILRKKDSKLGFPLSLSRDFQEVRSHPCIFFFPIIRWINGAKFLTGFSAVGSMAIPAILHHANLIEAGAMWIAFTSFFILVCTILCFHRANLDEDW